MLVLVMGRLSGVVTIVVWVAAKSVYLRHSMKSHVIYDITHDIMHYMVSSFCP